MIARYKKYELNFKRPAGTSRGVYKTRSVWYLILEAEGKVGIGECAPLPDLSKESPEQVELALKEICDSPMRFVENPELLLDIPSVRFGLETAWLDLKNGGKQELFPSEFTRGEAGIPINGLIWMGDSDYMESQITEKIAEGFRCIKLKIGAINFDKELELLQGIRYQCCQNPVILRVDANGAFNPEEALEKLDRLAELDIHSIEQPIAAGQWSKIGQLCDESPIPIALDEELIGVNYREEKEKLLDAIRPQYLVLKPSLHGGISGCDEWIELAEQRSIGWWVTSYLESNIGLNAIAQWAFTKNVKMHQGLGTGQLFTNNIISPLNIQGEKLWFNPAMHFHFTEVL